MSWCIERSSHSILNGARVIKNTSVELDEVASMAHMRWLHTHYGQQLEKLPGDTPLWVSLARGCDPRTRQPSYGQALCIQAIGQICKQWTGTAHAHRLHNTLVMGMLGRSSHNWAFRPTCWALSGTHRSYRLEPAHCHRESAFYCFEKAVLATLHSMKHTLAKQG